MFAAPPLCNLIVIRSRDIEKSVRFYSDLGMYFNRESHGNGPEHYSYVANGIVFEIYPLKDGQNSTSSIRIGFSIDDVDGYMEIFNNHEGQILSSPKDTEWGRRAVIKDLDGHVIELITPKNRDVYDGNITQTDTFSPNQNPRN